MPTIPSVYFCGHDNCSATFTRLHKFEIHERSHTGERPFVCDFDGCNKSYVSLSHLKRHQEIHENSYRCSVEGCSSILKTKSCLKKHLDSQHGGKKPKTYKCSCCEAQFNKHGLLQQHMFLHTGEFPHVCPEEGCGRGFMVLSKLKRHMKRHEGYPCTEPNCNQVFLKWSDLVKHKKQSHPVVYRCEICEKVFSCSSNLKRHGVVHGSERELFQCTVPKCTRFYTLKKNLVHHMKSYHARRPFMCTEDNCSRAFQSEDLLAEHIKYHNTKKPNPKKKKKHKPSLAAKLAGCCPKKTRRKIPIEAETADNSTIENNDTNTPVGQMGCAQEEKPTQSIASEPSCVNSSDDCDKVLITVNITRYN